MMNKAGVLFEIIWFVMGGLFLFIGVQETMSNGIENSWYYLVFALLALLLYYRRRRMRISNK